MNIFFSQALEQFIDDEAVKNRILSFIKEKDDSLYAAISTAGQVEAYYQTEKYRGKRYQWLSIRLSRPGRLMGVIVKNLTTNKRYFFGLEYTPPHDISKTLGENEALCVNWRNRIDAFLSQEPNETSATTTAATSTSSFHPAVFHQGRVRILDVPQKELASRLISEGILCFGSAGAGKTLIGIERATTYAQENLSVVYISPTEKLAQEVDKELRDQGIKGVTSWSYHTYIQQMFVHYPAFASRQNGRWWIVYFLKTGANLTGRYKAPLLIYYYHLFGKSFFTYLCN